MHFNRRNVSDIVLQQEILGYTDLEGTYYFVVWQIIPNGGETMGAAEIKRRIARSRRDCHARQQNSTILSTWVNIFNTF